MRRNDDKKDQASRAEQECMKVRRKFADLLVLLISGKLADSAGLSGEMEQMGIAI